MGTALGRKVWNSINDTRKKGEIVAEGRVVNKWILQKGKSNIILVP